MAIACAVFAQFFQCVYCSLHAPRVFLIGEEFRKFGSVRRYLLRVALTERAKRIRCGLPDVRRFVCQGFSDLRNERQGPLAQFPQSSHRCPNKWIIVASASYEVSQIVVCSLAHQ